jgi:hypothetical protein
MAVAIALVATIPLSILVSCARDHTLRRRSRFWLRFAAVVVGMSLPWIVALSGSAGEQLAVTLMFLGIAWAMLLVALTPMLLFAGRRPDSGPSEDDGGGPGPGPGPDDDRRSPEGPIGGLPLPDAEPGRWRVRGPHTPGRPREPRRPGRDRDPRPARVPLRRSAA